MLRRRILNIICFSNKKMVRIVRREALNYTTIKNPVSHILFISVPLDRQLTTKDHTNNRELNPHVDSALFWSWNGVVHASRTTLHVHVENFVNVNRKRAYRSNNRRERN